MLWPTVVDRKFFGSKSLAKILQNILELVIANVDDKSYVVDGVDSSTKESFFSFGFFDTGCLKSYLTKSLMSLSIVCMPNNSMQKKINSSS